MRRTKSWTVPALAENRALANPLSGLLLELEQVLDESSRQPQYLGFFVMFHFNYDALGMDSR